ncbi:unnamed protein product [Didymodactylos carnosus]|uniref:RING-type domain-containing protein n=1 Tax=Didymodactylos carnosus TaxID=1234261 RepID=A0A813R4B6_9BILA|nr:unnamed protein product [Didymodactylos carnosus]CAF1214250.1 unnamed protein product [Didymodactylos carnosus]CAF3560041.1 unnamed protein product [Didymodactylos carnosus]CAF4022962.1 unnamed protein product [Didymodactylos carnosus]
MVLQAVWLLKLFIIISFQIKSIIRWLYLIYYYFKSKIPFLKLLISKTKPVIDIELDKDCSVCFELRSHDYYMKTYGKECKHLIRTVCDICVFNHIETKITSDMEVRIPCPEYNCPYIYDFNAVKSILLDKSELFDRYDALYLQSCLRKMPAFVRCSHGCGSGQFHDKNLTIMKRLVLIIGKYTPVCYIKPCQEKQIPLFMSNDLYCESNIVTCHHCQQQTCFYHRIPWIDDYECQKYTFELSKNDRIKQCPKCSCYVEKTKGCDIIKCRICRHRFCWTCFAQVNLLGYGHKRNCKNFRVYSFVHTMFSIHLILFLIIDVCLPFYQRYNFKMDQTVYVNRTAFCRAL